MSSPVGIPPMTAFHSPAQTPVFGRGNNRLSHGRFAAVTTVSTLLSLGLNAAWPHTGHTASVAEQAASLSPSITIPTHNTSFTILPPPNTTTVPEATITSTLFNSASTPNKPDYCLSVGRDSDIWNPNLFNFSGPFLQYKTTGAGKPIFENVPIINLCLPEIQGMVATTDIPNAAGTDTTVDIELTLTLDSAAINGEKADIPYLSRLFRGIQEEKNEQSETKVAKAIPLEDLLADAQGQLLFNVIEDDESLRQLILKQDIPGASQQLASRAQSLIDQGLSPYRWEITGITSHE